MPLTYQLVRLAAGILCAGPAPRRLSSCQGAAAKKAQKKSRFISRVLPLNGQTYPVDSLPQGTHIEMNRLLNTFVS